MMAFVEDICLDPNTAKCRILLAVLERLYTRVKRWEEGIHDNYFFFVRKGYYMVKVSVPPLPLAFFPFAPHPVPCFPLLPLVCQAIASPFMLLA